MKRKSHSLKTVNLIIITTLLTILSSCNAYKGLPYLKNVDEVTREQLLTTSGIHEARIMPNDILSITVNSTIPGAATDFNLPLVPTNINSVVQSNITNPSSMTGSIQNYLVDKDGKINFPVLGELKISGMTTEELQDHITSLIYPRYISQQPIVNIRFLNFKVSVLGEVARPGIYETENGQMTIFDALAAAGDMTIYGKRNNVLLIRTTSTGQILTHRINLQNEDILLNKDIYYLQQNDKLYVETNKAKGNNSRFGTFESISLSALSIVISVIAIVTR